MARYSLTFQHATHNGMNMYQFDFRDTQEGTGNHHNLVEAGPPKELADFIDILVEEFGEMELSQFFAT